MQTKIVIFFLTKIFFRLIVLSISISVAFGISNVYGENILRIGLLQEPKMLNVWSASDRWSRKVLDQLYQPLYIREPNNLKLIPWLAKSDPVYNPSDRSYTVYLRPAKWSDGSELTSEDVAFTGRFIKEFRVPLFYSNWSFIQKIETPDKRTVRFYLKELKAIFLTRTLTTPIVQKKEWDKIIVNIKKAKDSRLELLTYPVKIPISSGPFVLNDWKAGVSLYLKKNPHFFGNGQIINDMVLGPYIDGILFKIIPNSEESVSALKKGGIDMFGWSIPPEHLKELLENRSIEFYLNERNALHFLGFNVRTRPFNDINFRRAVATVIDRDYIITKLLNYGAVKMYSVVPPGNTFWYNADVLKHGDGLSREERVHEAYKILKKAGYTWKVPPVNADGHVVKGEGIIMPNGEAMQEVTILTPTADYDFHRFKIGMIIENWIRGIGIPVNTKALEFGTLMNLIKDRHQFDIFVLGYGNLSPGLFEKFFSFKK